MIRFITTIILVTIGSAISVESASSQAISIVAPSDLTNVEGNRNNVFPFASQSETMRYQQVFDATEFAAISQGSMITHIAFRSDASFNFPTSGTISSIQINLSSSAAAPDALSEFFASNLGLNDRTVYSGPLTLSSSDIGSVPRQFEFVITLQTPFRYDPNQGNLLLDVRCFSKGIVAAFDSHAIQGDSISRIWSADVNSSVANLALDGSLGLVTQFTFMVPEPSGFVLLALLGAPLLYSRRTLP
jgi:hypothetical protein